jgi:hypothetical protein
MGGIDLGDIYVDPNNPEKMVFGEAAKALNAQTSKELARGATQNVARAQKKKQQQQSAQSVKNLLADLNVMEPGVKNLLGL